MKTRIRSLLFVPGDRPDRMRKALDTSADGLILDLEDSVSREFKPRARQSVSEFLQIRYDKPTFVRINPLDGPFGYDDIDAIAKLRPFGAVIPKCCGASELLAVQHRFAAHGNQETLFLPIGTETPQSVFELGSYKQASDRLWGLTWGAEDLSAAVGSVSPRDQLGNLTWPYETLRAFALFAAKAAGTRAIDTVYPDLGDLSGLASYARRGKYDGFDGMLAVHPAQLDTINAAFSPTSQELDWAKQVVEEFAKADGRGVIKLHGKMLDEPHLKLAKALLAESESPHDC